MERAKLIVKKAYDALNDKKGEDINELSDDISFGSKQIFLHKQKICQG